MSRSNNNEVKNPAQVFFEWAGGKGIITYFDKEAGEKGEKVEVKLPFSFLVLDLLSCIAGFSEADNSGFWSNEIRDTRNEKLTVRTKKGIIGEGLYNSPAIDKAKLAGAQYAQSVYIAFYDANKDLIIGNIKFTGSAIGPWIEFRKKNDIYASAVTINKNPEVKIKGATRYFEPSFTLKEITPEANEKAIDLDKQLQEYLKAYFKRNETEIQPAQVVTEKQKEEISKLQPETASTGRGGNQKGTDDIPADATPPHDEAADDLPF